MLFIMPSINFIYFKKFTFLFFIIFKCLNKIVTRLTSNKNRKSWNLGNETFFCGNRICWGTERVKINFIFLKIKKYSVWINPTSKQEKGNLLIIIGQTKIKKNMKITVFHSLQRVYFLTHMIARKETISPPIRK